MSTSQAEPEEVPQTGSYDKLNLRPSLPRQAKNKKEQWVLPAGSNSEYEYSHKNINIAESEQQQ